MQIQCPSCGKKNIFAHNEPATCKRCESALEPLRNIATQAAALRQQTLQALANHQTTTALANAKRLNFLHSSEQNRQLLHIAALSDNKM